MSPSVTAQKKDNALGPKPSVQQQSHRVSFPDDSNKRKNVQSFDDASGLLDGRANAEADRASPSKRIRHEEIPWDPPFTFVVGGDRRHRMEFEINKDLICRHSPRVNSLREEANRFLEQREALKAISNRLRNAIINAGDHPQIGRPSKEKAAPQLTYTSAIVDACNEYPWAKTCEHFSETIAMTLGISRTTFERMKANQSHLCDIIVPALDVISFRNLRDAVKTLEKDINRLLSDNGDNNGPQAAVRAAAFNKMYLGDVDAAVMGPLIQYLESKSSLLLYGEDLLQVYLVADVLQMQPLQNKIVDNLRSTSQHTWLLNTPKTFHFICDRFPSRSPLRRLVIDVLLDTLPGPVVMGIIKRARNFEMDLCVIETLMEQLEKGPSYSNTQEICKRYHIHEAGQRCT